MDLSNFVVQKCPKTAIYVPNFITSEEEQHILSNIENAPKPKWTQLRNRRLLNYGGLPHANGMIAEEIPKWLQVHVDKINSLGIFESQKANHVLVNEYMPGQGIMPHVDGPLFYPTISTISCGSHTILEFIPRRQKHSNVSNDQKKPINTNLAQNECDANYCDIEFKLLLEPRSLLILKDDLYCNYFHSIRNTSKDILCDGIFNYNHGSVFQMGDCIERKRRISLTIRNVLKTSNLKIRLANR